jgi:seryl-tRNA synthetase
LPLTHFIAEQYAITSIGTEINTIQKQIGQKKKAKEDASELLQQKTELEKKRKTQEDKVAEMQTALRELVKTVGNYVEDSVPVSDNEDNNKTERDWAPPGFDETHKQTLSHHEVLTRLDGYDPTRGAKLIGHRGYCLTGYGFFLLVSRLKWTYLEVDNSKKHGADQLRNGIPLQQRFD